MNDMTEAARTAVADETEPAHISGPPDRHRLRGLARLAFGNPVSRGYLALVLAAAVCAVVDELSAHHPDASYPGVWALLLTAPTVVPLWLAGDAFLGESGAPDGYLTAAAAVAAVANALLLGLVHRSPAGGRGGPRRAVVRGGWHTRRHGDH